MALFGQHAQEKEQAKEGKREHGLGGPAQEKGRGIGAQGMRTWRQPYMGRRRAERQEAEQAEGQAARTSLYVPGMHIWGSKGEVGP